MNTIATILDFKNALMGISLSAVGLYLSFVLARLCWNAATTFCRNHRHQRGRAVMMLFFAIVATCAAQKATILFPRTDSDIIYIANNGSYVTNDFVHVDYIKHPVVPSSAQLFIDYYAVDDTNLQNVATLVATTFSAFHTPTNIPFAFATNYNFVCYTTWTPGSTVHTNGVLHANWGTASGSMANEAAARGLFWAIPVQTEIIENGKTTFPPKTQPIVIEANLLNELNEESQNE